MKNSTQFDIYRAYYTLFLNDSEGKYSLSDNSKEEVVSPEDTISEDEIISPEKLEFEDTKESDYDDLNTKLKNDIDALRCNLKKAIESKTVDKNRLNYAYITKEVYNEQRENIYTFEFITLLQDKYLDESVESQILYKLLRHTELAIVQKTSIKQSLLDKITELEGKLKEEQKKSEDLTNKLQKDLTKEKNEIVGLTQKLQETTDKWERSKNEIDQQIKKVMPEIIGIMGVFSTIIFAVFSGFNEITTLGESLSSTPIFKVMVYIGSTFIVLIGIIFISYFAVGKFFNKNLKSCECESNKNCNHNLVEKYPAILIFIWIGISFIAIGFILRFYNNYIQNLLIGYSEYVLWGVLLILLLIPVSGGLFIWKKGIYYPNKVKKEKEEKNMPASDDKRV